MAATGKAVWVGRGISVLASLMFGMSAFMKFKGGADVTQGVTHLGIPETLLVGLGLFLREARLKELIPIRRARG